MLCKKSNGKPQDRISSIDWKVDITIKYDCTDQSGITKEMQFHQGDFLCALVLLRGEIIWNWDI